MIADTDDSYVRVTLSLTQSMSILKRICKNYPKSDLPPIEASKVLNTISSLKSRSISAAKHYAEVSMIARRPGEQDQSYFKDIRVAQIYGSASRKRMSL